MLFKLTNNESKCGFSTLVIQIFIKKGKNMDTLAPTKFPKIFHPCLEDMPGNDWLYGLLKEIISKTE